MYSQLFNKSLVHSILLIYFICDTALMAEINLQIVVQPFFIDTQQSCQM